MAHFAELDKDNIVLRVIVVDDIYENDGGEFCNQLLGGTWVRTSYNTHGGEHSKGKTPFRKNYAGLGYKYDEGRDAFIPPKSFNSWKLDDSSCLWEAPVKKPTDGKSYEWNEKSLSWKEIQ